MANIRLVLEYNGAGFHGWQTQPGVRTIEEETLKILRTILREPIRSINSASRTDSGVHARGHVVNFFMEGEPDLQKIKHGISGLLRGEVSVVQCDVVPDDFSARKNAKKKLYVYTILSRDVPPTIDMGRVWFVPPPLDIPRMQREAASLVGRHDFKSFQGALCSSETTVRDIIESELIHEPPYLYYRIVGRSFLKHMVRNIVGTLVNLGKGNERLISMHHVLSLKDRRCAGNTAPAYGLCLERIWYDDA